jgi:transcriptional regulator with XRE-family HTH domain
MNEGDLVIWLDEAETVADVLRRLRLAQELTLDEVAGCAGLSKSYISMIEHGRKSPERDTLLALPLAAYTLPVSQANRVLLYAGIAPLHCRILARRPEATRNANEESEPADRGDAA